MKKTFEEFKTFISKGNVLDMAVGVIIGGAFGNIVSSLVNDILMPLLGVITGGVDFTTKKWILSPEVLDEAGTVIKAENAIRYGSFIQYIINFLVIAICIFFCTRTIVKIGDKFKKPEPPKEEEKKPTSEELLTEIRDLLKEKQ